MSGPVIFLACALFLWAVVCLDDWLRKRRQYEAQIDMWADLLAQLREPSPEDLGREWSRYIGDLPETKR